MAYQGELHSGRGGWTIDMKMELTQRDKKLLVFLAVFVIVVCLGYWGIYPAITSIRNIDEEIVNQEEIKELNQAKINMLPIVKKDNEILEEKIEDAGKDFFKIMKSDEIDKLMTGMAITYSLHADSLDIQMPEDMAELEPYQYSDRYINPESYKEDEEEALISIQTQVKTVDEYAEGEAAESEEPEEEEKILTGIYNVHLKMRLSGEENNLQKFIDDLSEYGHKLQVASYSWIEASNVGMNDEGQYIVSTHKVLGIELDMYMCED